MHFTCESCRATLHIADEKVKGKRLIVRCKRCGNKITIADPALGVAGQRQVAAQKPAPAPELQPVNPDDRGDSDTESTRAMETSVLEEALRASKLAGEDAAAAAARAPPPPASLSPRDPPVWFAMVGGKQLGPMGRAELGLKTAQGAVGPRTYLWREGMGAWLRAKDVDELSSLFAAAPEPRASTPPPVQDQLSSTMPGGGAAAHKPESDHGQAEAQGHGDPASLELSSSGNQHEERSAPQQSASARADSRSAPLALSIEGMKPLGADETGESTNVEALPLGERVHQESVAKELFTSGEQSGASALDLANWASEELAKKEQQRSSATVSQGKPLQLNEPGANPGAEPLAFGGANSTSSFAQGVGRGSFAGDGEVDEATAARRKRTRIAALVGGAAVLLLLIVYALGGSDSAPPVKVEVAAPRGGSDAAAAPVHRDGAAQPVAPAAPAPEAAPAGDKGAQKPAPEADPKAAPAPASGPKAESGDNQPAKAVPGLRKDDFQRTVASNRGSYKKCIDEALHRTPKLRVGKVQIAMKIAPTGRVVDASIDKKEVQESALGQCLILTTQRLVFPPFAGDTTDGVIPLQVASGD